MDFMLLFVSAVLVNNFVLVRFLGVCPFLGVSRKIESAMGMGLAVIFVTTIAAAVCYMANRFILIPLDLEYLSLIVFILVIAALVQGIEMFIKKASPSLYSALGVFLPLITTNCAIVGVVLMNTQESYSFMQSVIHALGASAGFFVAIVIFAGIRERMERCDIPKVFQGVPIGIVAAGLMSMAFLGFTGMI
ncbi:MAG: electron transport complex subunit RsxA [Defluviitaleaceae bacterium]|nr:electron transport complex subunit RsxA [Defluviitaleaceae bacterium]